MAIIDIQYSEHVRPIRCSAETCPAVAARIYKAAPGDINVIEKRALRDVGDRANDVKNVQSERDRLGPARLRPLLQTYASGWSGLHDALLALARVPAEVSNRGERALAIAGSLFPDGVSFTQLPADAAWGEGSRRLERIKQEGLRKDLEELVGRDFLVHVEGVTAKLADTIGTGRADKSTPSSNALLEALTRFGRAVGKYALVLAASVDEENETSVERFLRAVQPIEAHRATMVRGGGGAEEEEDVVLPVVPPVVLDDGKGPSSPGVVVSPTTTTSPGVVTSPVVIRPTNGSPTSNGLTPSPVVPSPTEVVA